jgi:hypothetical protein
VEREREFFLHLYCDFPVYECVCVEREREFFLHLYCDFPVSERERERVLVNEYRIRDVEK